MWEKPTTFAVKKEGVKKARRVLKSKSEAKRWIAQNNEKGLYIEERPGERSMCLRYCDARTICPRNVYNEKD
jgi:hypothetical protein